MQWVPLQWEHLGLCSVLGGVVVLAHYATSRAYRYAGVSFLTPFSFLRLILGIGVGYGLFGESPDHMYTWIGMGVILSSIIILTIGRAPRAEKV